MTGEGSFVAALRRATLGHRPIEPLLRAEVLIEASRHDNPAELADALQEAAALPEHHGVTAVLSATSLAFAVVNAAGPGFEAGPGLQAWLESSSDDPVLRGLMQSATRGHPQLRSLSTVEGEVIVVYVAAADQARTWPLPAAQRRRLEMSPHWVVLAAMAATRSPDVRQELASLFDLTAAEAGVVAAFLNAPTVEVVARRLGASVASTRDALDRAKRKIGCRNSSAMTRRVLEALLRGQTGVAALDEAESLRTLLDLTAAEVRVALLASEGLSAAESARSLGVSVETVKSHLRSAFGKVGVNRSRELARVVVEARALDGVRRAAEVVTASAAPDGRLRLLSVREHRTVAFIDYGGDPGARALFVCHGFAAGRTLPRRFVELLKRGGWRPLVPQRPGYGLTDPAASESYFATAADDMAAVAASLGCDVVDVLARDSSAPALFALCERHPERVDRAVLLNPKSPVGSITSHTGVLAACSRFLTRNPALVAPFVEMLRRQCRTELLERVLTRACSDAPSDADAIAHPAVMSHVVEDIQALLARSSVGAASEQAAYARWVPTRPPGPQRWSAGWSLELGRAQLPRVWRKVLGVEPVPLSRGGYLIQFTYPEDLLQLLGGAAV